MIIVNIIWKLTNAHSCRPLLGEGVGGGGEKRGSILIRGSTTIVQSTLMMISLRLYKRQSLLLTHSFSKNFSGVLMEDQSTRSKGTLVFQLLTV